MPLLPTLLLLGALATAPAGDPCGLAGTYELDRAAVRADLLDSLDDQIGDLPETPPEGRFDRIRWSAERDALRGVRAEAEDGGIVPFVTTRLAADGSATQTVRDATDPGDTHTDTGRWTADAACETLTIDFGDHTLRADIEGDRLETRRQGDGRGIHGATLVRVR